MQSGEVEPGKWRARAGLESGVGSGVEKKGRMDRSGEGRVGSGLSRVVSGEWHVMDGVESEVENSGGRVENRA